jgi:hypothetical protein
LRPDLLRPDLLRQDFVRPDLLRPDLSRPDLSRPNIIVSIIYAYNVTKIMFKFSETFILIYSISLSNSPRDRLGTMVASNTRSFNISM